jgi:4-amino-4-deoxy-L-arabinose transferase-like glycosyltransferase
MPAEAEGDMIAGRARALPLPVIVLTVLALLAAAAIYFARLQNVWIDETTQLSGITLDPARMIRWLAGEPVPDFGVPADRMPPVSYLLDSLCHRSACAEPFHFRLLHLLFVLGGVAVLVAVTHRRYGGRAALVTGLFLALSPKLVEVSVEVRAYPILFALTCAQLALFLSLYGRAVRIDVRLAAFLLLGLVACYTHFFGLVSSSALFAALILGTPGRRDAGLLIAAYLVLLASAAGLIPFITAASEMSGSAKTELSAGSLAASLSRVVGHSSSLLSPIGAAFYLGCIAALIGLLAARIALQARRDWREALAEPLAGLMIALAAGLLATLFAALIVRGFDPLKTSYSIWMLPLVALLLGGAVSARLAGGTGGRIATAAAVFLLLAAAWGQINFLRHAQWFVHGPGDRLLAEIGSAPEKTAIVYVGPEWSWGFFPLFHRHRGRAPQWLADGRSGGVQRLHAGGRADSRSVPPAALAGQERVLLVQIALRRAPDLRDLDERPPPAPPLPPEAKMLTEAGWLSTGRHVEPGLYSLNLWRFEKGGRQ